MRGLSFLSLFTGIGGMDLGMERAGHECVGQVELNGYCRRVLDRHWPGVKRTGDVRSREFVEGEAKIVVAGFPCQDTSNAGDRAGVAGLRSGLYRHAVRALRLVRPLYGVLENVAGLLARGMGRVLGDLAEIGYDAEWDCLPAGAFGARHWRDRVFVVAYPVQEGRRRVLCDDIRDVPTPILRREAASLAHACDLVQRLADQLGEPVAYRGPDGVAHRVERLGAVGNAVFVPVAEHVGRMIAADAEIRAGGAGGRRAPGRSGQGRYTTEVTTQGGA